MEQINSLLFRQNNSYPGLIYMKQVTSSAFFFTVSQGKSLGLCARSSTIKAQTDHK